MPRPADSLPIPARAIEAAARALWGDHWQSPMAKALKLDLRRVQRWAAAARADEPYYVSRGLLEELLRQLERKHFPLQRAYEDLKLLYERG